MIKIQADERGKFSISASESPSPVFEWLTWLSRDPSQISPESDRLLLQSPSSIPEVNEDWKEFAEEEIISRAEAWRLKFSPEEGVLRFEREDIPELAAYLNRARLKLALSRDSGILSASPLREGQYEFLTLLLEIVIKMGDEFAD
jgi:hypothetical protein